MALATAAAYAAKVPRSSRAVRRRLAAMVLVDASGTGLFLAVSAVFLTGPVGLSAGQVGAGLSVSAALGLITTVPIGVVATRVGVRRILVVITLWRAAAFGTYALVHDMTTFLVVVCVLGLVDKSAAPLTQTLVAEAVGENARVSTMAMLRAVRNVGFTVGGLLGGLALTVDTREAYAVVILADAGSFLVMALVAVRLPLRVGTIRPATGIAVPRVLSRVVRDSPYTALTAVNSVLTLHTTLLSVGIPVWVVEHTQAPKAVLGPLLAVNTLLVVAFAVRTSRAAATRRGAGVTLRRAGLALAACCLLLALVPALSPVSAVVLLLAAVVVLTAGELLQAAGSWALSFDLAPVDQQAVYLSFFSLSVSVQQIVAPSLVLGVVVAWGTPGWLLLAGVVAVGGSFGERITMHRARHRWSSAQPAIARPTGRHRRREQSGGARWRSTSSAGAEEALASLGPTSLGPNEVHNQIKFGFKRRPVRR